MFDPGQTYYCCQNYCYEEGRLAGDDFDLLVRQDVFVKLCQRVPASYRDQIWFRKTFDEESQFYKICAIYEPNFEKSRELKHLLFESLEAFQSFVDRNPDWRADVRAMYGVLRNRANKGYF